MDAHPKYNQLQLRTNPDDGRKVVSTAHGNGGRRAIKRLALHDAARLRFSERQPHDEDRLIIQEFSRMSREMHFDKDKTLPKFGL